MSLQLSTQGSKDSTAVIAHERVGENWIGKRASAPVQCRRLRRSTSPTPLESGGSSERYRGCPALYSGNSHWDRRKRSNPAPGSLAPIEPTQALRTSSTARPLHQKV